MRDKTSGELPFDDQGASDKALWDALSLLPSEEPSVALRQGFYTKLEQASRPRLAQRLRDVLGFRTNTAWLTAAACVLIGLAAGQLLQRPADTDERRLAALEENVSVLNRSLILDRLENDTASKRLRGVIDAAFVAGNDSEITRALLQRATEDRVPSVRSAAINALGPQLKSAGVGEPLMQLLRQAESPLVQLAIIDLVLRHGSEQQIAQLLQLADDGSLHPDLTRHVLNSLNRDIA